MSEFKEVLEIEKKFQKTISKANSSSETKLNKSVEELKLKEEVMKKDLNKELNAEIEKIKSDYTKQGEKEIEKSKIIAENILKNTNVDKAVKYLVEEFKNGF